jgi:hypothetical protein
VRQIENLLFLGGSVVYDLAALSSGSPERAASDDF